MRGLAGGSRSRLRRAAGALGLALAAGLALELAARLADPLRPVTPAWRVILPVNERLVFENPWPGSRLPREIPVRYNGLGFRGPERAADPDSRFEILTLGPSTAHSARQAEGTSWPDRLRARLDAEFENVWLNNAGMEGQSTFGHRTLLLEFLSALEPDLALLLVGINERSRDREREFDARLRLSERPWLDRIVGHSELLSGALVLLRSLRSARVTLTHWEFDLATHPDFDLAAEDREGELARHDPHYVALYRARLEELLDRFGDAGIEVVLMTQPALWGDARDPTSGREIAPLSVGETSASLAWAVLELYNDVTRAVAAARETPLIDLARAMPKDSLYFYDWIHFTEAGAAHAGGIVGGELAALLRGRAGVVPRAAAPAPAAGS